MVLPGIGDVRTLEALSTLAGEQEVPTRSVNVPVTALLVVAGLALLPESRTPAPERADLVGAALTLLTMAPLVLAVTLAGSGGPV